MDENPAIGLTATDRHPATTAHRVVLVKTGPREIETCHAVDNADTSIQPPLYKAKLELADHIVTHRDLGRHFHVEVDACSIRAKLPFSEVANRELLDLSGR